jgi:hypothetical protein
VLGVGRFAQAPRVHVTSTNSEAAVTRGAIVLRATKAGTYSARLSNGRRVRATIGEVPASRSLKAWKLDVSDWHRAANGQLEKTSHSLALDTLKPWSQIPELQDVSGVGTYTTTVRLPATWTGGRHATLHLGEVFDTFRVRVNGKAVATVDQVTGVADISRYLEAGVNEIQVRVATTLRNRLRVTPGFPGQASEDRQDYGLIGPVVLQPYGQRKVWKR